MPEAQHSLALHPHAGNSHLGVLGAGADGYKAPLVARVHLRLGMWQWTITPHEVCLSFCATSKDRMVQ